MKLYLEITQDRLALPVSVCISLPELARRSGLTITNVASQITRGANGEYKYPRFIRVEVDD